MTWLLAWGTPAGELVRALGVGVGFLGVLAAAEIWKRHASPPPEWPRKLVHVGGGLLSASFPWLFSTHWTVLLLCAATVGVLAIGTRFGFLGSVVGVGRRSAGELYFPMSTYLLFLLAGSDPVFYLISLFALVVSDTAAALVGSAYGRHGYTVATDRKSLEGSVTFFLATFLGVLLILLLGTQIERAAGILIAAQLALLVTSFEAISMRGNDNLIVPLATYYLLVKLTPGHWQGIGIQLAVQFAMLVGMVLLAWRSRFLTLAGAIAAHLVLYAAFSLGGPVWTVAPVMVLMGSFLFDRTSAGTQEAKGALREVREVFYVGIVSVALLFLDNTFATLVDPAHGLATGHPFFVPFVGSFAATLAIVGLRALRWRRQVRSGVANAADSVAVIALALLIGWLAVAPITLWLGPSGLGLWPLVVTAATCVLAVGLYWLAGRVLRPHPIGAWDLRLQALCVAISSGCAFPVWLRISESL